MTIPLAAYDFFGYLACGFLALVGFDGLDGSMDWLLGRELQLTDGVFAVFLAYSVGQIVSGLAKLVLENGVVDKLLYRPSLNLVATERRRIVGRVLSEYYTPLPERARERIMTKARASQVLEGGEDLFLLAWTAIKGDVTTAKRLAEFRDRYALHRNLCMTYAVLVPAGCLAKLLWGQPIPWWWLVSAGVLGLGSFFRYLKFFRQYSYEVFTTYARAEASAPSPPETATGSD